MFQDSQLQQVLELSKKEEEMRLKREEKGFNLSVPESIDSSEKSILDDTSQDEDLRLALTGSLVMKPFC